MLENFLDQSMPKELWDLSKSLWENFEEVLQPNNSWTSPVETEEKNDNDIKNENDDKNTDETTPNNFLRRLMDINVEPPPNTIRISSRSSQRTFSESSSNSEVNTCAYCRNLNYPYDGHTKRNCPVLASLAPCFICGATGKYNHTATHCPSQTKTVLMLKNEYLMRWIRRRRGLSPV